MFPRTPYSFPREEVVVAAAKGQKASPSAFCIAPPPSSKVLRIPNLKLKKAYVANWGLQIASKEGGLEWSKRRVFLPKTIRFRSRFINHASIAASKEESAREALTKSERQF